LNLPLEVEGCFGAGGCHAANREMRKVPRPQTLNPPSKPHKPNCAKPLRISPEP